MRHDDADFHRVRVGWKTEDVLVGAALGHFLTAGIHDSMMGLGTPVQIGVNLDGNSGGMLTFHVPF